MVHFSRVKLIVAIIYENETLKYTIALPLVLDSVSILSTSLRQVSTCIRKITSPKKKLFPVFFRQTIISLHQKEKGYIHTCLIVFTIVRNINFHTHFVNDEYF